MRIMLVALLAISCGLIGCGKTQTTENTKMPEATSASTDKPVAGKLVVLKVPSMTCPHGCWPTVKETLESQPGVAAVELAQQASEDTIDKPEVTVRYDGEFNAPAAIEALAKSGFDGAEVMN